MLTSRSYESELLDADHIPMEAFGQMLKEINNINTWLGGHAITLKGLQQLLPLPVSHTIHIAEIGCGGGDNLAVIYKYCKAQNIPVQLTGIDIRPECIAYAEKNTADLPIQYLTSDYKLATFDQRPDIIFNSLFCHHFKENELEFMLQWMQANSRIGFFINDLHRHMLAFQSIRMLTKLFSRSYMVKYDAPLSVRRGFTKAEWDELFKKAGISNYSISWKWAFRHLILCRSS